MVVNKSSRDSFSIYGVFGLDMDHMEIPGFIEKKESSFIVTIYGDIFDLNKHSNAGYISLPSSNNAKIFGTLQDGTYIELTRFLTSKTVGGFIDRTIVTVLRAKFSTADPRLKAETHSFAIHYDDLLNWAYFPKVNKRIKKGHGAFLIDWGTHEYNHKDKKYTFQLNYYISEITKNTQPTQTTNHAQIRVIPEDMRTATNENEFVDLADSIRQFLTLLILRPIEVLDIKGEKGDLIKYGEYTFLHTINAYPYTRNYFYPNHALAYQKIQDVIPETLGNFLNADEELTVLINTLLKNMASSSETSLVNYISGIDFNMRNEQYNNGNQVSSLKEKILRFLNYLPENLMRYVANDDKNGLEEYAQKLVDTRDYAIHGVHSKASTRFHGIDIFINAEKMKWIIHIVILLKLGFPEKNVVSEIVPYLQDVNTNLFY